MFVPRFWARASEGTLTCLGWSDESPAEASRHAGERLAAANRRAASSAPGAWDYYPGTPVKEEILDRPAIAGLSVLITRNRAGAKVLNVDRAAFIDIDAAPPAPVGFLQRIFGAPVKAKAAGPAELARLETWAGGARAKLRVYRTTRGYRALRMDAPMDPAGADTQAMFEAVACDPQYRRLCGIQKSFRARLTPKPSRVAAGGSPGTHPRDETTRRGFDAWLKSYEAASRDRRVCEFVAEYGSARPDAALQAVAELHDRITLAGRGDLV